MDMVNKLDRRFCVAPMMDRTDRHCRYLLRLLSHHVLLYSEMIPTGAILHGDRYRHLAFHGAEHPVGVQLGGSDPQALARCAQLAQKYGYDEVNLNVGCPSERVGEGGFGACLMAQPQRVAAAVTGMREAVDIPVTVKTRLGVDNRDSYEELLEFLHTVSSAGCDTFILHARKAWLQGLSPRENREIPPLRYDLVHRVKRDLPALQIILNGGITRLDEVEAQLSEVDGVMIGREVYRNPYLLADVDRRFWGSTTPAASREAVLEAYLAYMDGQLRSGVPFNRLAHPLLGLYQGVTGARRWRRRLSEYASRAHINRERPMAVASEL
ncbi:MAG: tRNA dihydrouridine(20/20a) synthase DusA [Gammaproteobacteria bacterium]